MDWSTLTDLTMKACRDTFNEGTATYRPLKSQPGQPDYTITPIVDEAHFSALTEHQVPVSTVEPMIGVRNADMQATPRKGDQVVLPKRGTYEVVEVQPDGQAGTTLKLRKLS